MTLAIYLKRMRPVHAVESIEPRDAGPRTGLHRSLFSLHRSLFFFSASNKQHPLGRKGDQMSQSSSDLNALLQQYSEQLMKMVKDQINQAKTTDKSDGQ